jgi:hypothetical protein
MLLKYWFAKRKHVVSREKSKIKCNWTIILEIRQVSFKLIHLFGTAYSIPYFQKGVRK